MQVRYLVSAVSPVKVEPSSVSLGKVVEGEDVSFTVYIVNNTAQTLRLTRFNVSTCGCLFEQGKLPETIPPQPKVPLNFGLRTENLPDQFQERLTFVLIDSSGTTFTPTVTLIGKVLREISVNPAFVDFGKVILRGVATRTLSLKSLTGQTFAIDRIETPPELNMSSPIPKGVTIQLRVSFQPRERPGWREGKIKLHLKGLLRKEVVVPFKAMVDGVIDTDPNFLNFGVVTPQQTKTLVFRVINRSGEKVRLHLINKPPFMKIVPTQQDLLSWRVELKVPHHVPNSQILGGKIIFQTSLPLQPLLEVPVFAAVEKARDG